MIAFARTMIGHWPGGLGIAATMAAALFSAVSGSSPATVVAIGSIMLPAMLSVGYPKRFAAGVIVTGGALGNLIPPSIIMVIYAVATSGAVYFGPNGEKVASASVGQLFMAGMVPGVILAIMLSGTTWYRAWKNNIPRVEKASWGEAFKAFVDSFWGVSLIVVVLGGIYLGWFTPTEAAAMSAVYAFLIEMFIYKDLQWKDVPKVLLVSANMSAMILYIVTNAVLFSFLMTSEQIPQAMSNWITNSGITWITFLLVVNLLLLLGRQRDGAVFDRADHGADPLSDRGQARHPSGAFRHHDRGQHGNRHVPSAGRSQSLCRLRHRQDGHHRTVDRGAAVAGHAADLPRLW